MWKTEGGRARRGPLCPAISVCCETGPLCPRADTPAGLAMAEGFGPSPPTPRQPQSPPAAPPGGRLTLLPTPGGAQGSMESGKKMKSHRPARPSVTIPPPGRPPGAWTLSGGTLRKDRALRGRKARPRTPRLPVPGQVPRASPCLPRRATLNRAPRSVWRGPPPKCTCTPVRGLPHVLATSPGPVCPRRHRTSPWVAGRPLLRSRFPHPSSSPTAPRARQGGARPLRPRTPPRNREPPPSRTLTPPGVASRPARGERSPTPPRIRTGILRAERAQTRRTVWRQRLRGPGTRTPPRCCRNSAR